MPGLVDLSVRLREPGHKHEGMLVSEMAAAVAGGITSVVCPPDTEPVLDEPGLVEMLRERAQAIVDRMLDEAERLRLEAGVETA